MVVEVRGSVAADWVAVHKVEVTLEAEGAVTAAEFKLDGEWTRLINVYAPSGGGEQPQSLLHFHGCSKVPSQPWSSLGIGGRSAEPCPGCPPAWSHSAVRSTCTSPCHTLGGHCDRTRRLGGNASIGYSDRNSAVTDGVHIPRTVG